MAHFSPTKPQSTCSDLSSTRSKGTIFDNVHIDFHVPGDEEANSQSSISTGESQQSPTPANVPESPPRPSAAYAAFSSPRKASSANADPPAPTPHGDPAPQPASAPSPAQPIPTSLITSLHDNPLSSEPQGEEASSSSGSRKGWIACTTQSHHPDPSDPPAWAPTTATRAHSNQKPHAAPLEPDSYSPAQLKSRRSSKGTAQRKSMRKPSAAESVVSDASTTSIAAAARIAANLEESLRSTHCHLDSLPSKSDKLLSVRSAGADSSAGNPFQDRLSHLRELRQGLQRDTPAQLDTAKSALRTVSAPTSIDPVSQRGEGDSGGTSSTSTSSDSSNEGPPLVAPHEPFGAAKTGTRAGQPINPPPALLFSIGDSLLDSSTYDSVNHMASNMLPQACNSHSSMSFKRTSAGPDRSLPPNTLTEALKDRLSRGDAPSLASNNLPQIPGSPSRPHLAQVITTRARSQASSQGPLQSPVLSPGGSSVAAGSTPGGLGEPRTPVSTPPPPPLEPSPYAELPSVPQRDRFGTGHSSEMTPTPLQSSPPQTSSPPGPSDNTPDEFPVSDPVSGPQTDPMNPSPAQSCSIFLGPTGTVMGDSSWMSDGYGAGDLNAQIAVIQWLALACSSGSAFRGRRIGYDLQERQHRTGTHGITNFAVGEPPSGSAALSENSNPMQDYALKFYTDATAFERVCMLFKMPPLASCMRAVVEVITSQTTSTRDGPDAVASAAPPCTVTLRCETLEEWAARSTPNTADIVEALLSVSHALAKLHRAGFVCHNVKASDLGWLDYANAWVLLDFSRTVVTGRYSAVPLQMPPALSTPEAEVALQQHKAMVPTETASDIWALGRVAYELLSGVALFPGVMQKSEIRQRLVGKKPLPWERGGRARAARPITPPTLNHCVFECLSRDPSARPSAEEVAVSLECVLRGLLEPV